MFPLSASLDLVGAMEINLADAYSAGEVQHGMRRVSQISGGWFKSPDFAGEVIAGGSDWQLIRGDGVAEIDARLLVKLEDGSMLSIRNQGYRHGPAESLQRVAQGENVDPSEYYFGSTVAVEVNPGPLSWLSRTLLVANGARVGDKVRLAIFALNR